MSCPANPPPPVGYEVWRGTVPPLLAARANDLLKISSTLPYGTVRTWTHSDTPGGAVYNVLARVDYHTWHFDAATGKLLTNLCWKGITLYKPIPLTIPAGGPALPPPVLDPATSLPDPTLAVYDNAPAQTDWRLVAGAAVAIVAIVGGVLWVLRGR